MYLVKRGVLVLVSSRNRQKKRFSSYERQIHSKTARQFRRSPGHSPSVKIVMIPRKMVDRDFNHQETSDHQKCDEIKKVR
jgi:hypothetical protein